MPGGTLIVSREVNLLQHYKQGLEKSGYRNVEVTSAVKDGLNMVINEVKPRIVFIDAYLYDAATPYMVMILVKWFKKMNIQFVVFSMAKYPADLGMWFIVNDVKSFLYYPDGIEEFKKGLECVRNGEKYISPTVLERYENREQPEKATELTDREIETARLVCNGYTGAEIAETLHISLRTVNFHKQEIYNNLGIRNENEMIRVVLFLGIIPLDELCFYGRDYEISPRPRRKNPAKKKKSGVFAA